MINNFDNVHNIVYKFLNLSVDEICENMKLTIMSLGFYKKIKLWYREERRQWLKFGKMEEKDNTLQILVFCTTFGLLVSGLLLFCKSAVYKLQIIWLHNIKHRTI